MAKITPWQRAIAVLATAACFLRALAVTDFSNWDGPFLIPFSLGCVFLMAAVAPAPNDSRVWPAIPTFLKLHWGKAIALTVLAAVAGLTLMFLNERAEHFALIERQRQDEISRIGRQQFLAEREMARQAKISDCIKQSPTKEAYWTQYAKWHCEAINPQVHSGQIEETVAAIRREQKRSRQSN